MRRSGLQGWRFVHPDLGAATDFVGGSPTGAGLQLDARPGGGVALVSDDEAIRQAILLLLSTQPGERLMRPDYGCHLGRLVFAPNDDNTAAIAVYYVRRAIQQWEPRVDIVSLDAYADPYNPTELIISLEYQVRATRSQDRLELALALDPAGG